MITEIEASKRRLHLALTRIVQMADVYAGNVAHKDKVELGRFAERLQSLATVSYDDGTFINQVEEVVREGKRRFPGNGLIVSLSQAWEDNKTHEGPQRGGQPSHRDGERIAAAVPQ